MKHEFIQQMKHKKTVRKLIFTTESILGFTNLNVRLSTENKISVKVDTKL